MLHSVLAVTARAGLPVEEAPAGRVDTPQAAAREAADAKPLPRASYLWAMLLARIDEAFPLFCPRCGEPMRIIAFVTDVDPTQSILERAVSESRGQGLALLGAPRTQRQEVAGQSRDGMLQTSR